MKETRQQENRVTKRKKTCDEKNKKKTTTKTGNKNKP